MIRHLSHSNKTFILLFHLHRSILLSFNDNTYFSSNTALTFIPFLGQVTLSVPTHSIILLSLFANASILAEIVKFIATLLSFIFFIIL